MAGPTHDADLPERPIDRVIRPFAPWAGHPLAGAVLLMAAAAAAVVWANSPWGEVYHHWLETPVRAGIGTFTIEKTLHHWINDGIMAVFFFLVGLEIKREVSSGELSTPRKAALPGVAAAGGMIVPALLYVALNPEGPARAGWGVPMATDIAFALGVLALLGDRVPIGLKVFLTALAIVDDIGAVLVIAVFYTEGLSLASVSIGLAVFGLAMVANLLHVRNWLVYLVLGLIVWFAFLQSGVHATIAALLMAFAIPDRPLLTESDLAERLRGKVDDLERAVRGRDRHARATASLALGRVIEASGSPLRRLEHALHPLVALFVLPLFALANAGVTPGGSIGAALGEPITLGVVVGLFVGKTVGVFAFSWVAVKVGIADLPDRVAWRQVAGVAAIAGIGFTMALFIAGLAFPDAANLEAAKLGILAASLVSGVVGWSFLRFGCPSAASRPAEEG
jgi:NhaA family Na+:H+ antiporter